MPDPVSALTATDNPLVSYLIRLERRITELERRAVGLGNTITIGEYVITSDGSQVVAMRRSDGNVVVIADFTEFTSTNPGDITNSDSI